MGWTACFIKSPLRSNFDPNSCVFGFQLVWLLPAWILDPSSISLDSIRHSTFWYRADSIRLQNDDESNSTNQQGKQSSFLKFYKFHWFDIHKFAMVFKPYLRSRLPFFHLGGDRFAQICIASFNTGKGWYKSYVIVSCKRYDFHAYLVPKTIYLDCFLLIKCNRLKKTHG